MSDDADSRLCRDRRRPHRRAGRSRRVHRLALLAAVRQPVDLRRNPRRGRRLLAAGAERADARHPALSRRHQHPRDTIRHRRRHAAPDRPDADRVRGGQAPAVAAGSRDPARCRVRAGRDRRRDAICAPPRLRVPPRSCPRRRPSRGARRDGRRPAGVAVRFSARPDGGRTGHGQRASRCGRRRARVADVRRRLARGAPAVRRVVARRDRPLRGLVAGLGVARDVRRPPPRRWWFAAPSR